ncbi:hypothetical protein [Streptomyces sp. NPDC058672]|uniref:hypothetical protein n=1 Tax=Streptomyces sp. NPDC058672 TaxID=3346591 RepID=UPI0036524145
MAPVPGHGPGAVVIRPLSPQEVHVCRHFEKPEPDRVPAPPKEEREVTSPPLWQEVRRRIALGAAGVVMPALLGLFEWWSRR